MFRLIRLMRALTVIVTLVAVGAWLMPSEPAETNAAEIAVISGDGTGPLVLAQFNPCPNRRCRR